MHFQRITVQRGVADRPGVEGADQAFQLDGRATEVEARLILVQLVRVVGQRVVLHFAFQRAGRQTVDGLQHRLRAELSQAIMQAAAGVFRRDRRADLEQHRSGVQARFHLHHGDAGLEVASLYCALDRRRAAPARQQGGVAVDAAQARRVEHHLRQDQAVGDHHHQVRFERRQLGLGLFVAQAGRLVDGYSVLDGELFDRARHQLLTTTRRAVRLGVDGNDVVLAGQQSLEVFGGEFRGAGKDDTQ